MMSLLSILKHAHSGWRWIVLVALVLAISSAISSIKDKEFKSRKIALFAFVASHIQLLLGLVLYFVSPYVSFKGNVMEDKILRFYTVEHFVIMLLGIVFITIGYTSAKKKEFPNKRVFWFYLIGLILILSRIPWPFMGFGGSWF